MEYMILLCHRINHYLKHSCWLELRVRAPQLTTSSVFGKINVELRWTWGLKTPTIFNEKFSCFFFVYNSDVTCKRIQHKLNTIDFGIYVSIVFHFVSLFAIDACESFSMLFTFGNNITLHSLSFFFFFFSAGTGGPERTLSFVMVLWSKVIYLLIFFTAFNINQTLCHCWAGFFRFAFAQSRTIHFKWRRICFFSAIFTSVVRIEIGHCVRTHFV